MRWSFAFAAVIAGLFVATASAALEPRDVILVVNKNVPASFDVAEKYKALRKVPAENQVNLDVPPGDDISRADFNEKIVAPLRAALKARTRMPRVLLSIYGMPLRVGPQKPTEKDALELERIRPQLSEAQTANRELLKFIRRCDEEVAKDPMSPFADQLPAKRGEQLAIQQKVNELETRQRALTYVESQASVDSELMLLWYDNYPLTRWVFNPLYWQFPDRTRLNELPIMMTCRLDGPNPKIAIRLVEDAIKVEKNGGLTGKVYVDARGIPWNKAEDKSGTGYGGYDESFRECAHLLLEKGKMDVILDDKPEVFGVDSCPDCALYVGWYALQNYRPCCRLNTGSVAWHLASLEAISLRLPNSHGRQWAGNLLADGAAATIGAVAEPYTVAFPKPAEFFGFLVSGDYTLVECYARTTLVTSWMLVLVGDPLYNPYAKTPKLKAFEVLPSPLGSKLGP